MRGLQFSRRLAVKGVARGLAAVALVLTLRRTPGPKANLYDVG